MKTRRGILEYFSEKSEDIPIYPIVEIAGTQRVLIENHLGVIQYSTESVGVRVKYGKIFVCGCNLTLRHMTKVKLVITGRIDQVNLIRRNPG